MHAGTVTMYPRTEMLDLIVIDGQARGIVTRNLVTGEFDVHIGDAVILAHRRIRERLLSFDQRQGIERNCKLARAQTRRAVRQSLLHADSPDVHPGFRRLPVQAHADERIASQRRADLGTEEEGRQAAARSDSRRANATTTSNAVIPALATSCRAT